MKKRAFNLLSFCALNVLFFAIYLNFIHKDVNTFSTVSVSAGAAPKGLSATPQKNVIAVNTPLPEKEMVFEN